MTSRNASARSLTGLGEGEGAHSPSRKPRRSVSGSNLTSDYDIGDVGGGGDDEDEVSENVALLQSPQSSSISGIALEAGLSPSAAASSMSAVQTSEASEICIPVQLSRIHSWLPGDRQSRRWELRYSLLRDGASLDTLIWACGRRASSAGASPTLGYILLVEDSRSHRFGAFLNHAIEPRAGFELGSGESFVFSFDQGGVSGGRVHSWTSKNDCFFLANNQQGLCVGGGGGDGQYALQIDEDLDFGSSGRCDTYDNEPLASSEFFKCLHVEVYEITSFV
jgi:hypothetical protein